MELRCLTTDHEFDALQDEWNTLAAKSPGDGVRGSDDG